MRKKIYRSKFGKIVDTITFPVRVLFMGTESKFGLSSLREERMRAVAYFSKGKVLDIGCGPENLFINEFIGKENGLGIDIFSFKGVERIIKDMTNIPFDDCSFDTITLVGVGGHIPKSKRRAEFKEFSRLLKPGGILVMTEGEPITQFLIHKWSLFHSNLRGELHVDLEQRGMEKDEEFCMPKKELLSYLNTPPLKLIKRKRFLTQWGLNNIYIAQKQ